MVNEVIKKRTAAEIMAQLGHLEFRRYGRFTWLLDEDRANCKLLAHDKI